LVGTLEAGGFFVDLRIDEGAREISPEIERATYRIMEEALVNAYKHGSPASRAQARLARTGDELELRVSNEIDPRGSGPSTGFGIVGIEEQARSLGGAAEVTTHGGVYELTVRLPTGAR
jgi:signal transduction histidine kinase